MTKAERKELEQLDRQLAYWAATDNAHKAEVARLTAQRDASGETARMMARGEAAHRKAWSFELARIGR